MPFDINQLLALIRGGGGPDNYQPGPTIGPPRPAVNPLLALQHAQSIGPSSMMGQAPQNNLPHAPAAPAARMPAPYQPPQAPMAGPFTGPRQLQRPQFAQQPQAPQQAGDLPIGQGNINDLPNFQGVEQQPQALQSQELAQLLAQLSPGQQSPGVPQQPHHNRFSALMRAIMPGR